MALQLLIGSSGSGKSFRMYSDLIAASMAHPEHNFIILVPEQYTMETQKNIVQMHPKHGVMNIDILSFGRLAYRIFEELGRDCTAILEDTGKRMVIRKLLSQKRRELHVFGGSVKKNGFSGELKSMISELLQYNVTPQMLEDCLGKMQPSSVLYGKLKDLCTIYEAFKNYIEGHYLTAEELLEKMVPLIADSKILKNSWVYLDNFTGFTPSQYHVLSELLGVCRGCVMTLTIDALDDPYEIKNKYELFYLTKETLYRLEKLCKEIYCERQEDLLLSMEGAHRFSGREDLLHLQQYIFRKKVVQYTQVPENIHMFTAKNPGNEAEFVAKSIRRLVRDASYRYGDIAVITGDVAGYRYLIERAFAGMDIPYFIDIKRSILNNAFVECLRALLEMFGENFSYESVFRYLRSGFSGVKTDEADVLENYVRAFGIRGASGWQKTWMKRLNRMDDTELLMLNQLREAVFDKIWPLYEVFKNPQTTIGSRTQSLIYWIYETGMQGQLAETGERFERLGQLALSREYMQVYDIVMDLLIKLEDILGDEVVSIREYADILDAGFNEQKLGLIPPGQDAVIVGDIQRTRLSHVKVLFFIGVNEGIIPSPVKDGGLMNDREKEMLADFDVELSPTSRQMGYFEQFYIYAALAKASQSVILSWSQISAQGKALRPSSLVRRLTRLFPELIVGECERAPVTADCEDPSDWRALLDNEASALDHLITGFSQIGKVPVDDAWKELYRWFWKNPRYRAQLQSLLDAAFVSYIARPLSRAAVRALYGKVLENSVTTLENYASCAYAHFLKYALRLAQRETNEIKSPDLGLVFHKALELFSGRLAAEGYTWQNVPDEVREHLSVICADEAAKSFNHTALLETKRNQYQIRRLLRYMLRTTWAIQRQLQKGDFAPEAFEIRFDSDALAGVMDVELSQNVLMKLKGTIDRIDICEKDQNVYVKIVDYKSGKQKLDIVALYYGLSLQLVVYMNAARALETKKYPGRHIIPAGILYYNIDDPMLEADAHILAENDAREGLKADAAALEDQLLAKLKNGGLVNSSPEIIQMFDKSFTKESSVIPVAYTTSGALSRRSGAISTAQFDQLGKFVTQKVENFGEEILAGNIAVNPYMQGSRTACTYCEFRSVCGFDERIEGYKYRRLSGMKADDVWAAIGREVSDDGKVDG